MWHSAAYHRLAVTFIRLAACHAMLLKAVKPGPEPFPVTISSPPAS